MACPASAHFLNRRTLRKGFFTPKTAKSHGPEMVVHIAVDMYTLQMRPYHVENAASRPICEAKLRRGELVVGWVTTGESSAAAFLLPPHLFGGEGRKLFE
jgi:hypothetical protein